MKSKVASATGNIKDTLIETSQEGTDFTGPKTLESRSWIAEKLGGLSSTIEPKKEDPEPTFSQDMADAKEIASQKSEAMQANASQKADETKQAVQDTTDGARSWMADKVGSLKETVVPSDEEKKTEN